MFHDQLVASTTPDRNALLATPIIQSALGGRVTRDQYIAFLEQAYHHVRHTVPLLMICAARLPERLEWLRRAAVDYIEEEIGHDEWILRDLAACGVDAEAVRRSAPGMAHVLEGTSVALATKAASALQTALGLPDAAFTYLTSHGELDIDHTATFAQLMNRLEDEDDRADVIRSAKTFFRLYGDIFRSIA